MFDVQIPGIVLVSDPHISVSTGEDGLGVQVDGRCEEQPKRERGQTV
jgi:hypothetical protein